ncbi:MAG: PrcB C-terminal domain protein [Gemmatimonadetes bacterium]|nr:PrcB C-terminal domain protein [Gemmatimonadota bacterium]
MRRLVIPFALVGGIVAACHTSAPPSTRQGPDELGNAPRITQTDAISRAAEAKPEPYTSLDHIFKAAGSRLPTAARLIITDTSDYRVFWTRLTGSPDQSARPKVDFSREMLVIAAMGEQPCMGYGINVDTVYRDQDRRVYAVVRERRRGARCGCLSQLVSPVDIIRIPRTERPVTFLERVETNSCEER